MSGKRAITKQEKVEEILRCGKDPIYFINKYVSIQHPVKGRIPFSTYEFQDDVVRDVQQHRFNIVLKSRQLGLSTVSAAYAAWYALFHKDKNILVIATKLPTAINFIKKVKVALANVPEWLIMGTITANKQNVNFSNGSQIIAIPTSEDAGRSEALSLLIVDEAAFIRGFEDIWTGLWPTISTGGRALILSTPNGVGGMYYDLWVGAESGQNNFNPIKLPWYIHPEHDEAWFKEETKGMPKRKVAQEMLCDFLSSGDTFLQSEDLERLRDEIREPIAKEGFDSNVWIWKRPESNTRYVISADVARGDAADYSTFHIINADKCEVVAEYMGKIPPEKLAVLLDEWGRKYNNALACPENNTFGYFTCVWLRDNGYPRMYYNMRNGGNADPFAFVQPDTSNIPGFSTQGNTRPQILTKLGELIRSNQIKIYSQRLYTQMQSFVWINSKPVALKGSHDDLIMSLAIGSWLIEGSTSSADLATAHAYAMLKATSRDSRDKSTLPGGIDDVRAVKPSNMYMIKPSEVYRPRSSDDYSHYRDASDLGWLLK